MKLQSPLSAAFLLSVFWALPAFPKEAPPGMTEFNKKCPAPKLCGTILDDMDACKRGEKKACESFVTHYKTLLPEYDCQRPFDSTPTTQYTVPAIWLCGSHERLLDFLSRLQTKRARALFGSKALRQTLDGALAEIYLEQSLRVK